MDVCYLPLILTWCRCAPLQLILKWWQ